MLDLPWLLEKLSAERPVFHSEADFQFALAWHIQRTHPAAAIRLEYKPAYLHKRGYLDIWVRRGDSIDAIEVKYWKRRLDVEVAGERFDLSNQGAQDLARYDFFSDLARIESLVTANPAATGHVLALTNDSSYWQPPSSVRDPIDAAFRVHEGRVVTGELLWGQRAGAGTTRGRERILNLSGGFSLRWRDYSKVADGPAGTFRYLLADVAGLTTVAESTSEGRREQLSVDSEQIRETFAHFGLAMYRAQCVEKQLGILLASTLKPDFLRVTPEERDIYFDVEFGKTLGQLIKSLQTAVPVPQALERRLSRALVLRNWLSHEYFWQRSIQGLSSQGRVRMIDELKESGEFLFSVDEELTAISMAWLADQGVPQEVIDAEMEALRSESGVGSVPKPRSATGGTSP